MRDLKKIILLCLLAVFLLPLATLAEEEENPDLPGNPECKICGGTGKVTYGRKANPDLKLIEYCPFKDAGKRCPVLIGGWEPCVACEDWPGMQKIFDEHERIVRKYRAEGGKLMDLMVNRAKAPLPRNVRFFIGRHCRVFTDTPHSNGHGYLIWAEKNWHQFAKDFEMGEEEGSDWDVMWHNNKHNDIIIASHDVFVKLIEWYYHTPYMDAQTKMMGLKTLKKLGGIGFLIGRMSYASQQGPDQDERGIIHSFTQGMLYRGFKSGDSKANPFTAWITEGLGAYYQQVLRGTVTWYSVAYGGGTQRDRETWGPFNNWKKALAKANSVPKSSFDERTGSWKGLIPLDTLIRMRVTNIPAQGVAQGWALVHYLMGTGQRSKKKRAKARMMFKEFLKLVGAGVDQVEAFKKVYKIKKLSTLEQRWRIWLRGFTR